MEPTAASSVADAGGGGDFPRPLPTAVMDAIEPFARFAWINESKLARLLKITEKTLILLLRFLEKEKFLKREFTKGTQVKVNDAIAEKEDGSFSVLAGSYCCLDYSQIVDVTRYRLHRMKKSMKEKLDYRVMIEEKEYTCICKRRNK